MKAYSHNTQKPSILPVKLSGISDVPELSDVLNYLDGELENKADIEHTHTETFSTSEVATNKLWIDGKTIYRKVISFGALPNATTKNVAHGITNLDHFTSMETISWNSSKTTRKIDFVNAWTSTATGNESTSISADATNVSAYASANRSVYTTSYFILEYTKTV